MLTGYKVAPKTISIPKTIEIAPLTIPNLRTQSNLLVYPQDLKSTYNIRCRFEWILSVHAASSGHSAYNPWWPSLETIASFVQITL